MERVRRMGKPYRPKDHFFQRAKQPEVIVKVEALIADKLSEALVRDSVEVVRELKRAVPRAEANVHDAAGPHRRPGREHAGEAAQPANKCEPSLCAAA